MALAERKTYATKNLPIKALKNILLSNNLPHEIAKL